MDQIDCLSKLTQIPDHCSILPTTTSSSSSSSYLLNDHQRKDQENVQHGGRGDGKVIRNVWIGPVGSHTPLHTDPYHNLYCQIKGSKLIQLIDSSLLPKMDNINDSNLISEEMSNEIIHHQEEQEEGGELFPLFDPPYNNHMKINLKIKKDVERLDQIICQSSLKGIFLYIERK